MTATRQIPLLAVAAAPRGRELVRTRQSGFDVMPEFDMQADWTAPLCR